jgi:hypothetical protein
MKHDTVIMKEYLGSGTYKSILMKLNMHCQVDLD